MSRNELELLTLQQVADLWQVSLRTVERRAATGELHTVKLNGSRRVRVADAHRFLHKSGGRDLR